MKNNILYNQFYKYYLVGFFLILFLPLLAVSPFFFPPEWGKAIAFRIVFSLILALFFWQTISDESFLKETLSKYRVGKKAIWILLGIILLIILSTIFSSDIVFSLWTSPHRSGGAVNLIFCVLMAVVMYFILKAKDWQKLWNFSFLIGDLVVLFAFIQYFNLMPNLFVAYEGRPPSTLSNPILLAIYLLFLIFPAISFFIKNFKEKYQGGQKTSWVSKESIFYLASVVLFVFGIFISGSRAAYLGLAIGGSYFLIFYPKLMHKARMAFVILLGLAISGILYVSLTPNLPSFIANNPKVSFVADRISLTSITQALGQTRFSAWQTFFQSVKEKPILGWGPENQAVAFDRYYNPDLDYLVVLGQDWWDRAHNIFLDLSVSFGIPFLILYLLLFSFLFWKLKNVKKNNPEKTLPAHAIQSVVLAYFITLSFGFDSATTYLILFFIVGYSLYLISNQAEPEQFQIHSKIYSSLFKNRKITTGALLVFAVWFLWQFGAKPLSINAKVNIAEKLECPQKMSLMDEVLESKSFLDSYVRLKYAEDVKSCASKIGKEQEYIQKAIQALKEEVAIQPKYTRGWIMLAQFSSTVLAAETDHSKRDALKSEIQNYINQAKKLSPRRQEIYTSEAQMYFAIGDFQNMKKVTTECIAIDESSIYCYWYLGISEIALNETTKGEQDIKIAKDRGYAYDTQISWSQLALAYSQNKNYPKLVEIYENLVLFNRDNLEYHSTLAFLYRETGQYDKARNTVLLIIEIDPDAQQDVNDFLKTIPY